MASIHKQSGKPNWFCAYSTWDADEAQWKRRFRSTGTTDRKEAIEICRTWEKAAKTGKTGRLTSEVAREIIARGVADVFITSNRETLPRKTVREWCEVWLETKKLEAAPTTVSRYTGILQRFQTYLGQKADRDIASLKPGDIGEFRDHLAKELSRNSANLAIKTLRVCLGAALKQGYLTTNVANTVDKLKQRAENRRRPFTMPEIQRALKAAGSSEWYGMTLFGLYSGARLSDLAALSWRSIDVAGGRLSFVAKKTGQRLSVPLAQPLLDFISRLPPNDNPDARIFPALSKKSASKLSEGFRQVLADADLAEPPNKHSKGAGRNAARQVSELSFHSLRHSFVSILKSTGANEAVAMALAGHETKAISQHYTSIDEDTLRAAVGKLPDITK